MKIARGLWKGSRMFRRGTVKPMKMKLYVWEDVLTDYTDGVMFALAPSVEAARAAILLKDDGDTARFDLTKEPKVITKTEGFAVWGGG